MTVSAVSLYPARNITAVIACVDQSAHARNVANVAASLASVLDLPLTLYHVIEPVAEPGTRQDPLEWNLRRQQARQHLARLREALPVALSKVQEAVGEGERVQAICDKAAVTGSVLVIGASGESDHLMFRGRTAQQVLEAGVAPVLMVPKGLAVPDNPFSRILVPLDGSSFSESALVEAIRLAGRTGAELLLAHVVSDAGLMAFGLPEADDLALRLRLNERNRTAACKFLERTSRRIADQGLKVRSKCLKGDTRSSLQQTIAEEQPGLVILSARGLGGQYCRDLPVGSTASYLVDHLVQPVMLVPATMAGGERPSIPAPPLRQPAPNYAA